MRVDLITLFPEALEGYLASSIVGRARRRGLLDVHIHDPRRWAGGRHRVVDDRPYGGGPGMVIAAPPMAACIDYCRHRGPASRLLMTVPDGPHLDQAMVDTLAGDDHMIVICGHYEGIDERIRELYKPQPFSIGDLVISGGELAALILVDAVTRKIPGALGNAASAQEDSFSEGDDHIDHPCFTRPREFRGLDVPEVLMSGDHAAIDLWRQEERRRRGADRSAG